MCPTPDALPEKIGNSVRYFNGEVQFAVSDLASGGFGFDWGHTRIYSNQLATNYNVGQGYNWMVKEWQYLVQVSSTTVQLVRGMQSAVWWDFNSMTGQYVARNGAMETLKHSGTTFTVLSPEGYQWVFADFTQTPPGVLQKAFINPSVVLLQVLGNNLSNGGPTEVRRYANSGQVVESWQYTYNGSNQLTTVLLRQQIGGGSWSSVRQMTYTYYGTEFYGLPGDLKTTTLSLFQGSQPVVNEVSYYRYYTGATTGGFAHALQYALAPDAYNRLGQSLFGTMFDLDSTSQQASLISASPNQLAEYADYSFQYDSKQRVTIETIDGGSQSFVFQYLSNTAPDTNYNHWNQLAWVTQPDGSSIQVYTNFIGQVLARALTDTDNNQWIDYQQFDINGRLILRAMPSAVASNLPFGPFPPSPVPPSDLGLTFNPTSGLVYLYDYYTSTGGGAVAGYLQDERIQCGYGGSSSSSSSSSSGGGIAGMLRSYQYSSQTDSSGNTIYPLSSETSYRNYDGTGGITTSYSYTFQSGTLQPTQGVTTLPTVPTAQNGLGTTDTISEVYDGYGNVTWERGPRGFIRYTQYDPGTGGLMQSIEDVNTALMSGVPAGWSTPAGGGLHLITDYQFDNLGRTTQTLGPVHVVGAQPAVRTANWTVYHDDIQQVWSASGFATGNAPNYEYTLVNPVSITISDLDGRTTDVIQAVRDSTKGPLTASDSYPQSSYVRWSTTQYSNQERVASTRQYFSIPASGIGTSGVHYNETDYGYDILGRQNRVLTPGGTITRTVFDVRGLPLQVFVGTNDAGATDSDPTGGRLTLPVVPTGAPWQNQINPLDVNADGVISFTDANIIIAFLDSTASGLPAPPAAPPPFYDVNGDGGVSAIDALVVINFVNANKGQPTLSSPNNMQLVTENEYDYDAFGGGGDGNLTNQAQYVSTNSSRGTSFGYDCRNRQIILSGELGLFIQSTYDNLDQLIEVDQYDTSSSGTLLARTMNNYDNRGQIYQTIRYSVTGGVPDLYPLTDNTFYDQSGNVIESQPAGSQAFSKSSYDGAGRQTATYVGYTPSSGSSSSSSSSGGGPEAGDLIFEQTLITYDAASNVLLTAYYQRFNDSTGLGPLNGPGGPQPAARVSYMAGWFDEIGRQIASADYGTNGNVAPTLTGSPPASSPTVLVSQVAYDSTGQPYQTTDSSGVVTQSSYDAVGRTIETIQNYQPNVAAQEGCVCPGAAGGDVNITTQMTYNADGLMSTLTAKNAETGDQTTTWLYGTQNLPSGSAIWRADLLVAVIYPDAQDAADQVTYAYNRQGQVIAMRDQNGTVHNYLYDLLGRLTDDAIITLGTGVDGTVRRIHRTYEAHGLPLNVTSYNASSGGSVVNDVENIYNGFLQLTEQYQEHGGAVNTSTSLSVQYAYANGSANNIRPTSITYPNGRVISYNYNSGTDDALSRVSYLSDSFTTLAGYTYLGLGTPVQVNYPQPSVTWDLTVTACGGTSSDALPGLDQFGRVINNMWCGPSGALDQIQYGYDQVSNRTYRQNPIATAAGAAFDELYSYDGVHRLQSLNRGTLSMGATNVGGLTMQQSWSLDPTGNWSQFTQYDPSNSSNPVLVQQRTSDNFNEITNITSTVGPVWVTPQYDRNGNMDLMPQPGTPTSNYTAVYDAWNRLISLSASGSPVGSYLYDGQNWQISKTVSGIVRHYCYSAGWQVLEERLGTSPDTAAAERQFVWGLRYIDDLVCRDRAPSGSGPLSERFYALQDGNWNMDAIVDTTGTVQERYAYTAYGMPVVLNPNFTVRSAGSSYQWETLYAGYRWDAESGLHQVRRRSLNSLVGTWLQRDPDDGPQLNESSYARNSPLRYLDPFGLAEITVVTMPGRSFTTKPGDSNISNDNNGRDLPTIPALDRTGAQIIETTSGLPLFEDEGESRIRAYIPDYNKCGYIPIEVAALHNLDRYLGVRLDDDDCIKELWILGHGMSGRMTAGPILARQRNHPNRQYQFAIGVDGKGTLTGADWLGALKTRGRFCKPCLILLGGCEVGRGNDGLLLMKAIAKLTRCTVKAFSTSTVINTAGVPVSEDKGTGPDRIVDPP